LACCASRHNWSALWQQLTATWPATVVPVAVVYADGASVGAPGLDEILEAAALIRARAVLLDTAVKDGRSLLDHWRPQVVRGFVDEMRRRGLTSVVGGSLTVATIRTVIDCGADFVAVRGAACSGDRTGPLDVAKLRELRKIVV
jgi:uncharacterized protein (UPF0264 family)